MGQRPRPLGVAVDRRGDRVGEVSGCGVVVRVVFEGCGVEKASGVEWILVV